VLLPFRLIVLKLTELRKEEQVDVLKTFEAVMKKSAIPNLATS
jgi:hypothetical protein